MRLMPEQAPAKHKPTPSLLGVRGSDCAEQRARDLAGAVTPRPGAENPLIVACEALATISMLSAKAWGSDKERDDALRRINEIALGAWTQMRGR